MVITTRYNLLYNIFFTLEEKNLQAGPKMFAVIQLFQNPNVCLIFSAKRVCVMLLQLYTGILPFMPVKETHLEIFMPAHLIKLVPLLYG